MEGKSSTLDVTLTKKGKKTVKAIHLQSIQQRLTSKAVVNEISPECVEKRHLKEKVELRLPANVKAGLTRASATWEGSDAVPRIASPSSRLEDPCAQAERKPTSEARAIYEWKLKRLEGQKKNCTKRRPFGVRRHRHRRPLLGK